MAAGAFGGMSPRRRAAAAGAAGAAGAGALAARARAARHGARTGPVALARGAGDAASSSAEVEAAFRRFDADKSGEIERGELQRALARLGLPSSDEYVDDVFSQYDADGSGSIDLREFKGYVAKKERAMLQAFRGLDVDASGAITSAELESAVARAGVAISPGEARRMVALLDSNSDGVVTFGEFKQYLLLLPSAQLRQNAAWCWMGSSCDRVVTSPRDPLKQLVIGGIAGAASRTFTAPIERVRVMLMSSSGGKSAGQLLRGVLQEDGVAGLWRGNGAKVAKVIPSSAIQFFVYNQTKELFLRLREAKAAAQGGGKKGAPTEISAAERLLAGAVSAIAATLTMYPLDTVGSQMAVAGGAKGGLLEVGKQIVERGGVGGLYRGLSATVASDVWGIGVGFFLYDTVNAAFKQTFGRAPQAHEKGMVGGTCACLSMSLAMPLEVVMTRMRVQGLPGYPVVYKSAMDCLRTVAREEGVRALWRGIVPAYLKVFPMIFTSYYVFETLAKQQGVGGLRRYAA